MAGECSPSSVLATAVPPGKGWQFRSGEGNRGDESQKRYSRWVVGKHTRWWEEDHPGIRRVQNRPDKTRNRIFAMNIELDNKELRDFLKLAPWGSPKATKVCGTNDLTAMKDNKRSTQSYNNTHHECADTDEWKQGVKGRITGRAVICLE